MRTSVTQYLSKCTVSSYILMRILGYAVGFSLDVDPDTADKFFKDLPYE